MEDLSTIKEKFESIEDDRHQSYVEHKLCDILTIVMCAVLCGLDQLSDICEYAEGKADFLREAFKIAAIPSKPTFCRVLNMLDGEVMANVIIKIMRENVQNLGEIMSVDGKAICSTSKKDKPHSALQILTVYMTESGITVGQKAIHEKTNEIPVFQEMLDCLDVSGKTITADAMHCQKETCKQIIEKGGNYVFGLKENQKTFYDEVSLYFCEETGFEKFSTIEKGHGRIEKRICYKFIDITWLSMHGDWVGLSSVFAVKRITETKYGVSEEVSFYISSLNETPEKLLFIAREHWKIESLHWLLDVVFSEDECRILSENGLKSLNIFRKFALLLHRRFMQSLSKKKSLKSNMLKCLMNDYLLSQVLSFL